MALLTADLLSENCPVMRDESEFGVKGCICDFNTQRGKAHRRDRPAEADKLQTIRDFEEHGERLAVLDELITIGLIEDCDSHHVGVFAVIAVVPVTAAHDLEVVFATIRALFWMARRTMLHNRSSPSFWPRQFG